jgi:hypothetical protein
MIWEFFVAGLLLYGLAFLGISVLIGGGTPIAVTWYEGTRGVMHPRVMTPSHTRTTWASAPSRRSPCARSGSRHRAARVAPRLPRR